MLVLQNPFKFDAYRQPLVACRGQTGLENFEHLDIWELGMGDIPSLEDGSNVDTLFLMVSYRFLYPGHLTQLAFLISGFKLQFNNSICLK